MAKVDLRNKAKTIPGTPFKSPEFNLQGIRGTIPFNTGVSINQTVSDDELPSEVVALMNKLRAEENEIPEGLAERAIEPPVPVNIDELPEAKQKEIMDAIINAGKVGQPTPKPKEPKFIPRGPGIAQAKALADRMANQEAKKPAPKLTPKPEPKPVQVPVEAPPIPITPPEVPIVDIDKKQNCVHCGWQVGVSDHTNPTRLDKQIFVASILGQKRFTKDYDLLGGKLKVTFRSLTTSESDLIVKQLMQDWNDGKISGPAHSVVEATKYQLAIALASIETSVGSLALPELAEYEFDPPEKGTVLPDFTAHVGTTAIPNEHTRRIISKAYGHFIDTTFKLEAMAENPDFWSATGD